MSTSMKKAIRSILVHLDGSPSSVVRLQTACRLASRTAAQLCAMFVAAPPQRSVQLALSEAPAALLQTEDWAAVERARSSFDEAASACGATMRWLDSAGVDQVDAFFRQALHADMLVLGQHDPLAAPGTTAPAGFVESALIDTGRPALIVPHTGSFDGIGSKVLIGWNATPQAAHAVGAALPWLHDALGVHVLDSEDAPPRYDGEEFGIARYLQAHGIAATVHRGDRGGANAGDRLLSLASDLGATLLVMGCYGHSRTRELMLGGATRTVLQTMTLPVLMAH